MGSARAAHAAAPGDARLLPLPSVPLRLFSLLACLLVLGTGGTVDAPDGAVLLRVTASLAERGSFAIDPLPGMPELGRTASEGPPGGSNPYYAKYGPLLSVAAVPGYLAGKAMAPLSRATERGIFEAPVHTELVSDPATHAGFSFPNVRRFRILWYDASAANYREAFAAFGAGLTNAFLAAAAAALVCATALETGLPASAATAAGLLALLATPLWAYSKTFFAEPAGAALLALAAWLVRKGPGEGRLSVRWIAAGAAVGALGLAKPVLLVLALPAAAATAVRVRDLDLRSRLRALAAMALGFALPLALIAAYNHARFGSLLETGYGAEAMRFTAPLAEGLAGLLASPGRGLLVYCPLVLLALAGASRQASAAPDTALLAFGSLLVLLLLHSGWYGWDGGWCWGPRFLVPALPLLALPALLALRPPPASVTGKLAAGAVIALSVAIAFSGTLVHFVDYCNWIKVHFFFSRAAYRAQGLADYAPLLRWDPWFAPVFRYWTFPVRDYALALRAIPVGGVLAFVFGLAAAGAAASGVSLARALRRHGSAEATPGAGAPDSQGLPP